MLTLPISVAGQLKNLSIQTMADAPALKEKKEFIPAILLSAALAGDSRAQFEVGLMYLEGYLPQNSFVDPTSSTHPSPEQKAVYWVQLSANNVANSLSHDIAEVNKELLIDANPYDTNYHANIYLKAALLRIHQEKGLAAIPYFQLSADRGNHKASYFLGIAYEDGFGVEKNDQMALVHYQRSLTVSPRAYHLIGRIYARDEHQDCKEAFHIFIDGAKAGNAECCFDLANIYYSEKGREPDSRKYSEWMDKGSQLRTSMSESALKRESENQRVRQG